MKITKEEYGKAIGFVEFLAWQARDEMENLEVEYEDKAERETARNLLKSQYEAIETLLYILYNMDEEVK